MCPPGHLRQSTHISATAQTTWTILYTPTATVIRHAMAPLADRHQLLCSRYEIWRQSFLCGRASRVEQFASGSSSRGQFKRRLKSHFFSLCFNDWQCNALQVRFRAWRALNSLLLTYLLTYLPQSNAPPPMSNASRTKVMPFKSH